MSKTLNQHEITELKWEADLKGYLNVSHVERLIEHIYAQNEIIAKLKEKSK